MTTLFVILFTFSFHASFHLHCTMSATQGSAAATTSKPRHLRGIL